MTSQNNISTESLRGVVVALRRVLKFLERADTEASKLKPLPSVSFAVDAVFGGTAKMARLTGQMPSTISSWRVRNRFTPEWHHFLAPMIEAKGYDPDPPKWFNQKVPA